MKKSRKRQYRRKNEPFIGSMNRNYWLIMIMFIGFLCVLPILSLAKWTTVSSFANFTFDNAALLNQTTGTGAFGDVTDNGWLSETVNCISGNCLNVSGSNKYGQNSFATLKTVGTMCFWFKPKVDTTSSLGCLIQHNPAGLNKGDFWIGFFNCNGVGTADGSIQQNFNWVSGGTELTSKDKTFPAGSWVQYCGKVNSTGHYMYINGSLSNWTTTGAGAIGWFNSVAGDNYFFGQGSLNMLIDEFKFFDSDLTDAQISDMYTTELSGGVTGNIQITLINPANGEALSTDGTNFTVNATAPSSYNFTNFTYYIWNATGLFNSTTRVTTESNVTNYTIFINGFGFGQTYDWNALACYYNATSSYCSMASSNYTFTNVPFVVNNLDYNSSVWETSTQTFWINISTNPIVSSVSGYFWYNGTRHSTSLTGGTGGIYQATNTIDIPLQAGANSVKGFNWQFTLGLTGGSTLISNSTIYNQQVNRTFITFCNASFATRFINFTTKSAENPFPIINSTFKSAWETWIGTGGEKRAYTYEDMSGTNSSWNFCGYPNMTYQTNLHLEYLGSGSSLNSYFLNNASLTNTPQVINLYALNSSKATVTVLKVVDDAQTPQEDVTIQIQFYDVGTGTFYTVGMAQTDFKGEGIAYLNWYDSLYKFVLIRNGQVIKTTNTTRISATPTIFDLIDAEAFSYQKFRDFQYNLYFNNATKSFVLTFTKPSGLVESGCLRVIKRTPKNDTEICFTCETSTSATLYCNIASAGNGTFIAHFYATGSLYDLDWIVETVGGNFADTIYGLLGIADANFYSFLFAGIVTVMMFVHPVFGILGALLGILGASALGFSPINYVTFLGIALIGGLIIWIIKR